MTAGAPLSYMVGGGSRSALALQTLAWGFSIICTAVVVIVAVLIWLAIRRSRARAASSDIAEVGREGGGLALIWWGVGLSVPVLVAMALWNFLTTRLLAAAPADPAITIEVTGQRWWWDIRYDVPDGEFTTANELVIPTGVPVKLKLMSGDVIHDFWVPKLGPKMDMIPGRTNQTWLEADQAGTYRGQCAEYCGLEHARMSFIVHAVSPAEYRQWISHQEEPAAGSNPPSPTARALSRDTGDPAGQNPLAVLPDQAAQEMFVSRCGSCHTARGTGAGAIVGPDLTHFGSRSTIAAGTLPNTPGNLDRWLADPQAVKPGVDMPRVQLTAGERHRMVAWLEGLT